jgi:hypothetical protein
MKFKILLILGFPSLFFAQKKDSLSKFQIGIGNEINFSQDINLNGHWSKINPNFVEPNVFDTSFHSSNSKYYSSNSNLKLTFQFSKKTKNNKFYFAPRLDFSYGDGLSSFQSWHKNRSFIYDTLTSNSSGEEYYLDSSIFESRSFSYFSRAIGLKLALNFDYKITNRWTLYTGFAFGFSRHFSHTQINNYYSYNNKQEFENSILTSTRYSISNESVQYDKTNAMYFPIKLNQYIFGLPFGIKYRLSTKNNLLSHFLLSYEYNFNQSFYKMSSKTSAYDFDLKLKQIQHAHFLRVIYEL